MNRLLPALLMLACTACASAEDSELEKVRKTVTQKLPGITAPMITESAAPGLYQVQKGNVFGYVTADGRYLIQGDMVDIVTGYEVTERQRQTARLDVLKQFGPNEVIEFAPKDGAKSWVTVFTDVDCGYCRHLHSQMAEYNAMGIGIRYLFYPRSGPNTESFSQAEAVWCSADRKEALTRAKRGEHITAPNCANPIQREYEAGDALGINATPMLILPDGQLVRGYLPPQSLALRINSGSGRKSALTR